MRGIEVFIVFTMAALDLSIVPGYERLNAFVLNTKSIKRKKAGPGMIQDRP